MKRYEAPRRLIHTRTKRVAANKRQRLCSRKNPNKDGQWNFYGQLARQFRRPTEHARLSELFRRHNIIGAHYAIPPDVGRRRRRHCSRFDTQEKEKTTSAGWLSKKKENWGAFKSLNLETNNYIPVIDTRYAMSTTRLSTASTSKKKWQKIEH